MTVTRVTNSTMSGNVTVTNEDVGKRVINPSGTAVGYVSEARNGVAYIAPDPRITSTLVAILGRRDGVGRGTLRVDPATIEHITDQEIRLSD